LTKLEESGKLLGTFTTSVSVLLNERNQSIEFTVIINVPKTGDKSTNTTLRELVTDEKEAHNNQKEPEPSTLAAEYTQHGYYFAGYLKTLERTLRTSSFDTVLSFFKLLQDSLSADHATQPLFVIEESNTRRAQWLVSEEQNGARSVTGYLPLTHSTAFHSLKAYPMLHYKSEELIFDIVANIDRNRLFPKYPELDAVFTDTLKRIATNFDKQKWSYVVVPKDKRKLNEEEIAKMIVEQRKYLELTIVSNLIVQREERSVKIDMLTISAQDQSQIVQVVKQFILATFPKAGCSAPELDKCRRKLTRLIDDMRALQDIFQGSEHVLLYNPFLTESSAVVHHGARVLAPLVLGAGPLTAPSPTLTHAHRRAEPVSADPPIDLNALARAVVNILKRKYIAS
jgi:hypothetical protein